MNAKAKKIAAEVAAERKTKSAAIRELNALGLSRSDIAALLKIRYQHVRNVLITPLTGKQK